MTTVANHASDPATSDRLGALTAFFWPRPWVRLDADEHEAFAADCDALMVRLWPRIGLLLAGAALLWWPLDPIVYADRPLLIETCARLRASVIGFNLVAWLYAQTAFARRFAMPSIIGVIVIESAGIGWWVGSLGALEGQWMSYFFVFPVVTLLLFVGPARRLFALGAMCAAYLGAMVIAQPMTLRHPDFLPTVGFLVFVVVMSFSLGHLTFELFKGNFAYRRRLATQRDALDALAASLESQVAEQTDELRRLARRVEDVRESERKTVAAEIHDHLGQTLTAIRYGLSFARSRMAQAPDAADLALSEVQNLVGRTSATVRRLLARLNPRVLEELGLFRAAEWLVGEATRHAGLKADVRCEGVDDGLPERVATGAFRILQESINNTLKHAAARSLDVRLAVDGGHLRLRVRDDGRGPQAGAAIGGGLGLVGMRERAQTLGGSARWGPTAAGGFEVTAELPLAERGDA